jgi:MoxR-like ATPase
MFKGKGVAALGRAHEKTLQSLVALEDELKARFHDMDEPITALALSVAAGEALLLVGPPGTAKSRLVRAFCQCVGLLDADMRTKTEAIPTAAKSNSKTVGNGAASDTPRPYFEYLLTQFTEPGELFGFYDLAKLQGDEPKLVRDDANMMQHARIVFLDEVFNASSAILNSLLAFMNERKFHDRGKTVPVKLEFLVGATNSVPTVAELRAFFDRFLLRAWVHSVSSEPARIRNLVTTGWRETHSPHDYGDKYVGLLDGLKAFRSSIDTMTQGGELEMDPDLKLIAKLTDDIKWARDIGVTEMSNRRLVGFSKVILVHALLRWVRNRKEGARNREGPKIEEVDLHILLRYGVDRLDEQLSGELARRKEIVSA